MWLKNNGRSATATLKLNLHAFQINLFVGGLSSINRKSKNVKLLNLSPATPGVFEGRPADNTTLNNCGSLQFVNRNFGNFNNQLRELTRI